MSSIENIIKSIPDISRSKKLDPVFMSNVAINNALQKVVKAVEGVKKIEDRDNSELVAVLGDLLEAVKSFKIEIPEFKIRDKDIDRLRVEIPEFPKFPESIKLDGEIPAPIVNIPDSFRVNNLSDVVSAINDLRAKLSSFKFPNEIRVNNFPKKEDDGLAKKMDSVIDELKSLKTEALKVILHDEASRPYVAMGGDSFVATSTGGGGQKEPLIQYKAADVVEASGDGDSYFGFLKVTGEWYILRQNLATSTYTYRYVNGDYGYSTNWTNRASLSYDYYDSVFGG